MNKYSIGGAKPINNKKHALKIMRISLFLLLFSVLFSQAATGYSQEAEFTLELKSTTIKSICEEIESKSNFRFVYAGNAKKIINTRVDLNANAQDINEVLNNILSTTSLNYRILEDQVVIYRDDEKIISKDTNKEQLEDISQQQRTITGKVLDIEGESIIGANIVDKDNPSNGTVTDFDGNFTLTVNENATIRISYIGYLEQDIKISNNKSFDIILHEDTKSLDELVVIGYGQVRKGDATGSLSSVKVEEKNKGMQVRAEDALIGKVAGVNIVPGSGAPGEGSTIRIRMGASLTASNDPLIVIDGVPVDNNALNSINPNDIESFTVLKDASATAIYGSRASNGVIIVTTKKGTLGISKPKITYSANFSAGTVAKKYDVLSANEFRDIFDEYVDLPATSNYTRGEANTNWQDEIYRTALGMNHNVSVIGSTKTMPYRVSLGYLDQNGTLKENNYKRYNGGFGLSPKFLDDHLSLDINLKGSIERNRPVSTGAIGSAVSFDPTRPVFADNGNDRGLGYFMWIDPNDNPVSLAAINPVAQIKLPIKLSETFQSIGNVAVNYKIHGFEDLQLHANLGYDIRSNTYEETVPDKAPQMYTGNLQDGTGIMYNNKYKNNNYLLSTYANYNKEFGGKHYINAMAGYEWQRFWFDTQKDQPTDLSGNLIEQEVATFDKGELYLLSFFGRVNYTYDNKLNFTATLRSDGSSRFNKQNRWGYFPSAAIAYRIKQEPFLENVDVLSDLKFRLSYGQTGQQDVGGYYVSTLDYSMSYDNAQYLFGDNWLNMYRPNGADPNIKWETTSTYNVGLDYGFINNRVSGTVDVFTRRTTDLLNRIVVPAGSNFTSEIYTNIGNMKSNGVELGITAVPIVTKDWEWSISGNFTYSNAEITKLNIIDDADSMIKTGNASGRNDLQVHAIGRQPNSFFLLKQAYDENGKPLDKQYIAKDGSITSNESDSEKYILDKSSRVPYFYGLSSKVQYKDWDLGFNGHGSFGNYVYNYQQSSFSMENLYDANQISGNITSETLYNRFAQNRHFTDYFLESGAFFKIDNITLGYTWHKNKVFESLRAAFSVQNVHTFTKYSGLDPEIYSGIDNNTYMRPRTFTFSLNVNF